MGPETLFRMLLSTQRPGAQRLVVDVGANQGTFALQAARAGHRVIAFEPMPNNVAAFKRLVPPSAYPRVRLITKGVGAEARASIQMRGNSKGARRGAAAGTSIDVGATITAHCDRTRTSCQDVALTTLDTEINEPGAPRHPRARSHGPWPTPAHADAHARLGARASSLARRTTTRMPTRARRLGASARHL